MTDPAFEQFKSELNGEAAFASPVLPRDPAKLPAELPRGADIPADLDPLADGVLMQHQKDWLADESDLKICEKGRRTGITFAEALNSALIAAAARSAGGNNTFYIGDTKDKGREFIGYVAHFLKVVARELVTIEEFVFTEQRDDGSSNEIAAYRVRCASGYRVEALSSRPENIRGLQGRVVIDEAAYHKNIRLLLDAVNALLIWGGKIAIISTHNGVLNPFNELIREVRGGGDDAPPYKIHFIPFGLAVANGLYERTCLIAAKVPTAEGKVAWEKKIRGSYGKRLAAMKQELDCIPSDQEGAVLTRVQIENAMRRQPVPLVRWSAEDSFKDRPKHIREAEARDWCDKNLLPLLVKLDPERQHVVGGDFARSGDATDFLPGEIGVDLVRRAPFVLELRNIPFEQQRDVFFYLCDRLPRFGAGALDATGNGAYLAEVANQRYGSRIVEVKISREWYRVEMAAYTTAISDGSFELPLHEDVLRDHQSVSWIDGVPMVPEDFRFKGSDGFDRHGDTAIAGCMAHFASRQDIPEYGYDKVTLPPGKYSELPSEAGSLLGDNLFTSGGDFRMGSLRGSRGGL